MMSSPRRGEGAGEIAMIKRSSLFNPSGHTMSTIPPTAHSLTHRLDAEWEHLRSSPEAAAALAAWGRIEPALAGWSGLDELCAAVHDRGDPAGSDRILSALVRLAAVTGHGDLLAARVVLQLLLPGAIRLGRSLSARNGDVAATEASVFAELTILIRTYPWQRRPRSTAANLLLDCRQRLIRSYRRTRPEVSVGLRLGDGLSAAEGDDPLALKDLLWWAHRHGVLDPFEAQLLVASHVQQIPMTELATRFGRSRSSLFMIRASAEKRLRHALTD
jgi:hypothetical protein